MLASIILFLMVFATSYFLRRPKQTEQSLGAVAGDVDGNGTVDIIDFQLLSNSFGKVLGQTGYDGRSDFNSSNSVDILDFQVLSNNFGHSATITITPTLRSTNTPTQVVIPTPIPVTGAYNFGAYRPGLTLVEIQAWWNPIPDDNKGFGHEHILCWWPLGKRITDVFPDGIIRTDCRLTMHNNPSTFKRLVFHLAPGDEIKRIETGDLKCPYDGVNQNNCSWNIPITLDTNSWPEGWRHLRVRAVQITPDGNTWTTSSEIPIQKGTSTAGEYTNCRASGDAACFRGKSWYTGLDYENVEISGVPIAPVRKGTILTLRQRLVVGTFLNLQVFLDKSHFIPAVGPWQPEPSLAGLDLSKTGQDYSVSVDTGTLSLGWHSYAARVTSSASQNSTCVGCSYNVTNPNHQTGVAKFWFYIIP